MPSRPTCVLPCSKPSWGTAQSQCLHGTPTCQSSCVGVSLQFPSTGGAAAVPRWPEVVAQILICWPSGLGSSRTAEALP